MISPSTRDTSTTAMEEVVTLGASVSSVEAGTSSDDDVDGCSGSSSSPSKPCSYLSIKMLSPFPCHLHTQRHHEEKEQFCGRSHHMTQ
jgi:hypothetical protein